MSTSLLYHGFGVRGYVYVRTRYQGREVFTVRQGRCGLRCPQCDSRRVIRRGEVVRRFRTLPVGSKPVKVELPVQRVKCRSCGVVRQVKVGFAYYDHPVSAGPLEETDNKIKAMKRQAYGFPLRPAQGGLSLSKTATASSSSSRSWEFTRRSTL